MSTLPFSKDLAKFIFELNIISAIATRRPPLETSCDDKIRFLSIAFGGLMCGLAGAYMSIAYAPMWQENMVAGRGWIALALVVFATWKPGRALLGAYIFGSVSILQMNLQGFGVRIPAQFFVMAPYLATMIVLVLISSTPWLYSPSCIPFN